MLIFDPRYGKTNKKAYDPDYEHIESAKFKEFERLEAEGYSEELKDPDRDKLRNINAPGLGSQPEPGKGKKRPREQDDEKKFAGSDYIVPPKVPQMQMGPGIGPVRPGRRGEGAPGQEEEEGLQRDTFELPPEIANPQKAPCVNVPEWFVKEGGELCLSDTENGVSIIR